MKDQLVRKLFKVCQKDKHLKQLARRYWPVMVTQVDGHVFHLHPTDNTTEKHLYLEQRFGEAESLAHLITHMRNKRCLFIDIGANCGAYTIPLSAAVHQRSTIHAFEPSPVMMPRLALNLKANRLSDRVQAHQVALADESGHTTLHVHAKNHGQSSLRQVDGATREISVEQHVLSRYVPDRLNVDLFVIKIDVEGHEDNALYPFLEQASPRQLPDIVLIEMVFEKQWRHDLRQLFVDLGYRIAFEGDGNAAFHRERS